MVRTVDRRADRGGDGRRIAVVGAGVSGVIAARVLVDAGFDVTVFEQRADVGGVWSASRAYPGIATQDDRRSYAFSGVPFPASAAEHPTGAEVRDYLESYVRRHGLVDRLRLSTTVVSAVPEDEGWTVTAEGPEGRRVAAFDWLVAANGVFSTPHVPEWPGRAAFEAAGGAVLAPGALGDGGALEGRRVAVVGWGKTACDVAVGAARRGSDVAILARTLTWKYPKRIGLAGLTFHHLVLTRLGERVVGGAYRGADGRVLLQRLPERLPRKAVGRVLAAAVDRTTGLSRLGLRPALDISASTSLVTDGFFEAIRAGRLAVHRDCSVRSLGAGGSGPWVETTGGRRLAVDVVVAATGYEQRLPFLPEGLLRGAVDEDGALLLHRRILALDVPRLAFVGWAHSYRSPLTSELAATWLAGLLTGRVAPPRATARREAARFRLTGERAPGARTPHLPGVSMRELDELLHDLGVRLPLRVRLRQLWSPFDPADYAGVLAAAARRPAARSVASAT